MGSKAEKITTRRLVAADIVRLENIEKETFSDAWHQKMWLEELNNSLTTYLALEIDSEIVGYAGFWLIAGEAQITRVAIRSLERGNGLGTILTKALLAEAWSQGATGVTLEVREKNVAAQKAYANCGFKNAGVRKNYYSDNHEDAVIMWVYKDVNIK